MDERQREAIREVAREDNLQELIELRTEAERLRGALQRVDEYYIEHKHECAVAQKAMREGAEGECTCGRDEIYDAIDALKGD